jgi:replicative superfamily II helicase
LQEQAVRAGFLASEGGAADLLVAGPSASGKTFLLELGAVQAAHSGRRVLWLLPTEGQAAAVGARLRARYQRLGLRIGQLLAGAPTARPSAPGAVPPAPVPPTLPDIFEELDVALVSAAGLTQRMVAQPALLANVDLLLVDELEALADPRQGPAVELALLWLQRARLARPKGPAGEAGRGPRLLAMCTEVAGLPALANALHSRLVYDERRPGELRSGVVHGGRLTYFSSRDDRGSDRRYEEELHESPRLSGSAVAGDGATARLVAELCMRGEQTLVLVPDKARAVIAAEQLTAALRTCPPAPAAEALARLAETPDGQARTLLRETLSRGVALLDDGLLPSQRALVLDACRDGEVRVLCTTSPGELAQDLLPELGFRNVVVTERWTWRYQRRTRGYARDELGWLDWARICGRAARPHGTAPGRAMLLAPSRYDAEVILRGRVAALPEPLFPALRSEPLDELVLALVACQACSREAELVETLAGSVSGQALWSSPSGAGELRTRVGSAVESLVAQELLQRDFAAGAVLRATALGRLGIGLGLPVRTVLLMLRWAEAARQVEFTSLEVLLALALSPSGVEAAVPLLLSEQEASDYWSRTLNRAAAAGAAERPLFRWLREQAGVVRFEQTRALKKALLLCDWLAGGEGAVLETDYHVWLGSLLRAAGEFGRLVGALRAVCTLRGWDAARLQQLATLAEQLQQAPRERSSAPTAVRSAAANPDSGVGVARAVFSIRAALLAGRGAATTSSPRAAAAGGGRNAPTGSRVADHGGEPS